MLVFYSYRYVASKMHDEKKKKKTIKWRGKGASYQSINRHLFSFFGWQNPNKTIWKSSQPIILRIYFHSIVNICIIEMKIAITITTVSIEFHPKSIDKNLVSMNRVNNK